MSFNLMEMVKNYFTSDFTNQASSALGENTSGISKALTAIIPTGLAGILNRATSGAEGAEDIFESAKNAANDVSINTDLLENANVEKGNRILSNLFGGAQSGISNAISNYAGIKESSASSLMSMALPAVMGLLGKHAEQNNLSSSGLAGFLSSQKNHIIQAMPSGLTSLAGMLGLASVGEAATDIESGATERITEIKTGLNSTSTETVNTPLIEGRNKWLVPLIVILIAIALLWYFSQSCGETKPSTASGVDNAMVQSLNVSSTAIILPAEF